MQRKAASDVDQALRILFDGYAAVEAMLCGLAVLSRSQQHGCFLLDLSQFAAPHTSSAIHCNGSRICVNSA